VTDVDLTGAADAEELDGRLDDQLDDGDQLDPGASGTDAPPADHPPPRGRLAGDGEGEDALPFISQLARTTGILLAVLVPLHVGSLLLRDPETVDTGFLIDRWSNRAWLLADWGLLLVGTTHAVLSLWGRVRPVDAEPARETECPHCGERVPIPTRASRNLVVATCATLTTLVIALFLASSWAMLRLQ
jgi:hypothetical protein